MFTESYLERLKRLQVYEELWRDDRKFVEHRAGLYATLYFNHFHPLVDKNEAVREALIDCWQDYWKLVGGDRRKWIYRFGQGVHGFKWPSEKVAPIADYLRDPENFNSYQYYVHGGKHEDDASEYVFDLAAFPVYGAPEIPKKLGYLRLQAPMSYVQDERLTAFVRLVRRCAERLKVDQGHGGLGWLRTYNEENTTRNTEAQLSKIFSGVDVDVPYIQLGKLFYDDLGHLGIDAPHWINFLGNRWLAKIGGIEALRVQLPADTFVIEPCGDGVFIQAGRYPEPGHKQDGLPPAYVWLNRVLMPVRAPEMVYCMGDEPGQLARYQGAKEYFTRFDAASAELAPWPPKVGDVPASTGQPHASGPAGDRAGLRCLGGEACPRPGYWFTPARLKSRRRFAMGEVMPDLGSEFGRTIWQWDDDQTH